jgi:hypothetical protein
MSFLYTYLNYYLYGTKEKIEEKKEIKKENKEDDYIKVNFISIEQLKSVNLQPIKDIIPNPSRNIPPNFTKVDLRNLNKAQLDCILNVKLKPVPKIIKNTIYEPRHPCLKELLNKYNKK